MISIKDFLELKYSGCAVYLRSDCPDNISYIFDYYDMIFKIFTLKHSQIPELILVQPQDSVGTNILVLGEKKFVILDLLQVGYFSQMLELALLGEIDPNSQLSVFHALLADEESRFVKMTGKFEGRSLELRIKPPARPHPDRARIVNSHALGELCQCAGLNYMFLPFVVYPLAHEIYHHFHDEIELRSDMRNLHDDVRFARLFQLQRENSMFDENVRELRVGGDIYFHGIPPADGDVEEELSCDYFAMRATWSVCVFNKGLHPIYMMLFSSFFFGFLLLKDGIAGGANVQSLLQRKIYAGKAVRNLYEILAMVHHRSDQEFELVGTLIASRLLQSEFELLALCFAGSVSLGSDSELEKQFADQIRRHIVECASSDATREIDFRTCLDKVREIALLFKDEFASLEVGSPIIKGATTVPDGWGDAAFMPAAESQFSHAAAFLNLFAQLERELE